MNKLFKPRCLRRIILFLCLMFPIVYLVGGLLFALNGSHGSFSLTDVASYFENPFADSSFITTIGREALNGSSSGFNPINELIRLIDTNIFNFGSSDSTACFVYGYAIYSVNVLLVYEVVVIVSKLILLPLKAVDLFDGKGD